MISQEGTQQSLASIALAGVMLSSVLCSVPAFAANKAAMRADIGVQIPREILPWRRGIEERAASLLSSARETIASGNRLLGERQLQVLVRQYPRTFAARDAKQELSELQEKRVARAEPRRLGAPRAIAPSAGASLPMPPVAGWQTVVRAAPEDLRESLIEAAGDRVFFEEGITKLNKHARTVLLKQARWLKSNNGVVITIAGHADDPGSTEKNMSLAHDRAIAVQRQLMKFGVPPRRLRVFSFGNTKPIAICSVRSCAIQNRRVVSEIRAVHQADLSSQ